MGDGREETEFTSVCKKCGGQLVYYTTLSKIEKNLPSLIVFKCGHCSSAFMVSALASIRLCESAPETN
jgi:DNA-directed RNA polymerase subunit M/transcription elongation factor TFIIS